MNTLKDKITDLRNKIDIDKCTLDAMEAYELDNTTVLECCDKEHAIWFCCAPDGDWDLENFEWRLKIKPTYIPYTFETFPRGTVWIRDIHDDWKDYLVLAVYEQSVGTKWGGFTYQSLFDNHLISLDNRQTWHTAGELK